MKFLYEDLRDTILEGKNNKEKKYYIEEVESWEQDGKYQSRMIIFRYENKYYMIEECRSGSPFSGWEYEEQVIDKNGYIECPEMKKIPIFSHRWELK